MCKISIVTVCYNSEKTISKTFESLLNQTDRDFEYIVIDGLSTDKTLEIIKEYEPRFNGKMKYVSEMDNGLYDAMNKGIDMATGDYIGIINSDDWYENRTIETIKLNINKYPDVGIFYGYIRIIKDNKEYMIRRNNYEFINEVNGLIQHPTCFVSKSVYEKFGKFDTKYKVCADVDLMLRLVSKGVKYKGIDEIITNFVIGGVSFTQDSYLESNEIKYRYGRISKSEKNKIERRYHIRRILSKIKRYVLTYCTSLFIQI